MLHNQIKEAFQYLFKPTMQEIKEAISSLGELQHSLTNDIVEPSNMAYGRKVMFRSDTVEIILVHVPAFKQTLIHNHGESVCCALVVEGTLSNVDYQLDFGGYPSILSENGVIQNQYFLSPRDQIHQMQNREDKRLITFHVYTPPLSKMEVYLPYAEVLDYVI